MGTVVVQNDVLLVNWVMNDAEIAQSCNSRGIERKLHNTTTVLRPFVCDNPDEPVPEETLTHPPSSLVYFLVCSPPPHKKKTRTEKYGGFLLILLVVAEYVILGLWCCWQVGFDVAVTKPTVEVFQYTSLGNKEKSGIHKQMEKSVAFTSFSSLSLSLSLSL